MPVPANIPYPLIMDEKVYTTIDGQRMTEAEFEAWADKFTDQIDPRSVEDHTALWRRAITEPRHPDIPTEAVSVVFGKPLLDAIDIRAAEAGFTRDQYIELALLNFLSE